jgi:hypothetical protein
MHRELWFDDCFAAERSLAGARQLLREIAYVRLTSLKPASAAFQRVAGLPFSPSAHGVE